MVSGLSDDIVIAGFTSASVAADGGNNIIFGNEGDDTLAADVAPGRQYRVRRPGNDWVRMAAGAGGGDNLQANEGNDTIFGGGGVDTMAGGNGGDLFIYYRDTSDDGSSTGAVELITDLNSAADRIQTFTPVAFAFERSIPGRAAAPPWRPPPTTPSKKRSARQQPERERRGPVHLQRPHVPRDQPGLGLLHVRRYVRPAHRHHRSFGRPTSPDARDFWRPGALLPGRLTGPVPRKRVSPLQARAWAHETARLPCCRYAMREAALPAPRVSLQCVSTMKSVSYPVSLLRP